MKDRGVVPRILLWGTAGQFTSGVLQALIDADSSVIGVVMPGTPGTGWREVPRPYLPDSDVLMLPSFVARGTAERAWERHIPLFTIGGKVPNGAYPAKSASWNQLIGAITELAPTVIVVACWHTRLPDPLLAIPVWGGWNIHPSLLPAFRGPTPLFWQRRAGLENGGVTIHGMVHQWDAGDIYAQAPLAFIEGATMEQLDQQTGTVGGALLVSLLAEMAVGRAKPTPQPKGGSYQSFPTVAEFVVPTAWQARHAWNFMRAAESFGIPFTIQGKSGSIVAHRAIAFHPDTIIPEPLLFSTSPEVAVQFQSGALVVL